MVSLSLRQSRFRRVFHVLSDKNPQDPYPSFGSIAFAIKGICRGSIFLLVPEANSCFTISTRLASAYFVDAFHYRKKYIVFLLIVPLLCSLQPKLFPLTNSLLS